MFKKAVKYDAKGRVALVGPAGSGKSYTMLTMATLLAGDGKIAAIDTEHGSLSKYADLFNFDVIEMDVCSVSDWLKALTAAENEGYAVFLTDSLSHFWMGKGGALEFVDEKTRANIRHDSFAGWKEFRPHEREMVDRMISSPCHIICTMRTQTEYVEEMNDKGKKVRRKVGLKPVQRDGLEYEFDLVGAMDEDNNLVIDKSRVILPDGSSPYQGRAIRKPSAKDFEPFKEWLKGAKAEASPDAVARALHLIKICGKNEAESCKWASGNGKVKVSDLTQTQASKLISMLEPLEPPTNEELVQIDDLCKSRGWTGHTAKAECNILLKSNPDNMTRRQAQWLINKLKTMQNA